MPIFYCHLGNTPELSLFELEQVTKQTAPLVLPTLARIELPSVDEAKKLMDVLGGTVKIYQELQIFSNPSNEEIVSAAVAHLISTDANQKITYGVSILGASAFQFDTVSLKHALKDRNYSSRYVDSVAPYGVAAPLLLKNRVHELVLITTDQTLLAETVAIQDINDWTKRDRQKPYADRKKGMLPPKVARMMANIGLGLISDKIKIEESTVYDPFVGSGTVLMEALLQGAKVVGSDLDIQSVKGSQENLEWLAQEYGLPRNFSVDQRDATQHYAPNNQPWADAIVTEPFLGKPTPKEKELSNMFKGLHRLYLGAFKNWTHQLKDGSALVVVFPLVEIANHTFSLESLIDKLNDLGYTNVSQSIVYSRLQAIVQRQIQFFRFNRR